LVVVELRVNIGFRSRVRIQLGVSFRKERRTMIFLKREGTNHHVMTWKRMTAAVTAFLLVGKAYI
jgi:hypothetical protein